MGLVARFEQRSSPVSERRVMASPMVSTPLPAKGPHHSSKCAYASMASMCCHLLTAGRRSRRRAWGRCEGEDQGWG